MSDTRKSAQPADPAANSMWGGRFAKGPAEIMQKINASIDFDRRLYHEDITASKAHCRMLVAQKIIAAEDGDKIIAGLDQVLAEIEGGKFEFRQDREDIHLNIESRLTEIIGEAGGRLHTARSRNDQVATDFKLWVRGAIDRAEALLHDLQSALLDQAAAHAGAVMPGYTHLQPAQPVTLGHHMLAYVEMFGRDRGRFRDCRARLQELPLGAAALAGTSYPIDRHMVAEALGFDRPTANSLDAVSDRDFAIEFMAAAALCTVHMSRLAEELVIWTSPQWGFATLSDAFTSGSSIMPQKRNPDAAELVRAKVGQVVGGLTALLIALKGLPLAYGKDMQEDKVPTFAASDTLELCLAACAGMVRDLKPNLAKMREAAGLGFSTATDLADWLVRAGGVPFRSAHHIVGRLVKLAEDKGCTLDALPLAEAQAIEPAITQAALSALTVDASVASRTSYGGTAPANVAAQVAAARERFL